MTCTFFGHREINQDIVTALQETLAYLIEDRKVDLFYVGNQGEFDNLVRKNLYILKAKYPHIKYAVVLAYMPGKRIAFSNEDFCETIFPEELANSIPRFAIDKRNRWMLNKSDYVVCYVNRDFGGAAKFYELALRKNKHIINIADIIKNS